MQFILLDSADEVTKVAKDVQDGVFETWLKDQIPSLISFAVSVLLALVVYYIGSKLIHLAMRIFQKAMARREVEEGVASFLTSLIKYLLYVLLFVIILGLFGITATSISAAVAALGVTAGLALQGALSNFAGGVLILVMHPFKVGDYIVEAAGNHEGTVVKINIIYTTLEAGDGRYIHIPNGTLAGTSVENYFEGQKRRMDEEVGISYDADLQKAKEVLQKLGEESPYRLEGSEVSVFVKKLADSAVVLNLRYFVSGDHFWDAQMDMPERIKKAFDEAGVEITYNQLDVHIKKDE